MAVGDLLTTDWQIEYSNLLMGPGTSYALAGMDGLSMPDMRSQDYDRPQNHGQFAGDQYLSGRTLTVQLIISSATHTALDALLTTLAQATNPLSQSLIGMALQLPGGKRLVWCRVTRRHFPHDIQMYGTKTAQVTIEFKATDPRIYDLVSSTGNASGGSTSGGLGFAHGFPHGFGSASPGSVFATNNGNFHSLPFVRVAASGGTVTQFSIENRTMGQTFGMTAPMVDGDYMDIDFAERTVLLNGTASRIGLVTRPMSTWLTLQPGPNEMYFTYSGSGTGTMTVTWRSAWLY